MTDEMPLHVWQVPCPKCAAVAGEGCRTLTTRRLTDLHTSRLDAYYEARMSSST